MSEPSISASVGAYDLADLVSGTVPIFTIGHSTHEMESFVSLLFRSEIDVLVDTRSYPVSRFAGHFDQDNLRCALKQVKLKYLFFGAELGGRPKDKAFYDDEGYVLYWKIANSEPFKQGIQRLLDGVRKYRIALMCSEENPVNCHRTLLIGRVLREFGVQLRHIRGDGSIQTDEDLQQLQPQQMNIFSQNEGGDQWRSIQSVLRRKALISSSNP